MSWWSTLHLQHQEEQEKAELPVIYWNPWKTFNSNPVKLFSGSLGSTNDFPTVHCCVENMANPLPDRNSRSAKQNLHFPFYSHKVVPKQVTRSWVKLKELEIITQGRADGAVKVSELVLLWSHHLGPLPPALQTNPGQSCCPPQKLCSLPSCPASHSLAQTHFIIKALKREGRHS